MRLTRHLSCLPILRRWWGSAVEFFTAFLHPFSAFSPLVLFGFLSLHLRYSAAKRSEDRTKQQLGSHPQAARGPVSPPPSPAHRSRSRRRGRERRRGRAGVLWSRVFLIHAARALILLALSTSPRASSGISSSSVLFFRFCSASASRGVFLVSSASFTSSSAAQMSFHSLSCVMSMTPYLLGGRPQRSGFSGTPEGRLCLSCCLSGGLLGLARR